MDMERIKFMFLELNKHYKNTHDTDSQTKLWKEWYRGNYTEIGSMFNHIFGHDGI